MAEAKILVVDDDPAIRNLIYRFLAKQDYEMEAAEDGKKALALFEQFDPDLVILDVNLPDTNSYDLCKEMQSRTGVFVLMLTRCTDEADKIRGFSEGANDYLTKPFSPVELEMRVGAVLKRRLRLVTSAEQMRLTFNRLVIDPVQREVMIGDGMVPLTALEFNLLYFLARHPGQVYRRGELLQQVWDYDYVGDPLVVDAHVGQIRRRIENDSHRPAIIQTVRGVGYKFEPPDD